MKKLEEIIAEVMGVSVDEINNNTSPDNLEEWDSFNGLMLVSELEGVYGLKFTTEEVTSVKSVRDIKSVLKRHGIEVES